MTQDIVSTIACNIDSMSNQEISDIIDILSSTLRERMDDDVSSCEENEENEEDEYLTIPPEAVIRAGGQDIFYKDITEHIIVNVMSDEEYEIYNRFIRSFQQSEESEAEESDEH